MKFIFSLIKVAICIGLALGALMLMINTSFIYENYKTDFMDDKGIPIPRFMYYLDRSKNSKNQNAIFTTLVSKSSIESVRNDYLKNLTSCYGAYYYDKDNDITITKYDVSDSGLYRYVTIGYDYTNYCSESYILSDSWILDYTWSSLEESTISEASTRELINKLKEATRNLNPTFNLNYQSGVIVNLYVSHRDGKYYIEIKDIGENEVLVTKTKNNERQFAVYQMDNALAYLKSLK